MDLHVIVHMCVYVLTMVHIYAHCIYTVLDKWTLSFKLILPIL